MSSAPPAQLRRHMGLVFETARPIGAPYGHSGPPDVTLREGGPPPDDRLEGEPLAAYRHMGVEYYSLFRRADGYTLRIHTLGDFLISSDVSSVECRPLPGTADDTVSVLLTGTVTAVLWMLLGRAVLHASAVRHRSRAFALAGPSGSGKSTVAALCCAAGATLLSDDLLVLDPSEDGVRCVGRATELRLRPGMSSVTRLWPVEPATRETGDGRTAVKAGVERVTGAGADADALPLGVVALLRPSVDATEVSLTKLAGAEAVFALLGQSRVAGLADHAFNAAMMSSVAAVVREVPVVVAEIPWQPPFTVGAGQRILDALDALTEE